MLYHVKFKMVDCTESTTALQMCIWTDESETTKAESSLNTNVHRLICAIWLQVMLPDCTD